MSYQQQFQPLRMPRDVAPVAAQPQLALPGPDEGWQTWIAENLLRGCTPQSMLAQLQNAGLDAVLSQQAIDAMRSNPAFVAAQRWQQVHHKLASVVANQQKLLELSPQYGQVERRPCPGKQEFLERYVWASRPAVFTGIAKDWPAMQRWTLPQLKARFGEQMVQIQAGRDDDARFEENKLAHLHNVQFGAFIDRISKHGPSNDSYLTANNELLRKPEFASLLADVGALPEFCVAETFNKLSSFWLGPAGTNTPLHHDTLMLLHTQIVGRKRWRFISPLQTPRLYNYFDVYSPIDLDAPDWVKYPDFEGVQVLEVIAEPGDTVFLPLGWWHQVSALDVSVSLSYTNLDVPNHYSFTHPPNKHW